MKRRRKRVRTYPSKQAKYRKHKKKLSSKPVEEEFQDFLKHVAKSEMESKAKLRRKAK